MNEVTLKKLTELKLNSEGKITLEEKITKVIPIGKPHTIVMDECKPHDNLDPIVLRRSINEHYSSPQKADSYVLEDGNKLMHCKLSIRAIQA